MRTIKVISVPWIVKAKKNSAIYSAKDPNGNSHKSSFFKNSHYVAFKAKCGNSILIIIMNNSWVWKFSEVNNLDNLFDLCYPSISYKVTFNRFIKQRTDDITGIEITLK